MIIEFPAPRFFAVSEVLPEIKKYEESSEKTPGLYGYRKRGYLLTLQSGKTINVSPALSAIARFQHTLFCADCGCNGTHIQSNFMYHPSGYTQEYFRVMTWSVAGNKPSFLNLDHIIPKSLGGSNHISNFRITCDYCNTKRGNNLEQIENIDTSKIVSKIELKNKLKISKSPNSDKLIKVDEFIDLVYNHFNKIETFNKLSSKINSLKHCFYKALTSLKLKSSEPVAIKILIHIWKKYASPNGFDRQKQFVKHINAHL